MRFTPSRVAATALYILLAIFLIRLNPITTTLTPKFPFETATPLTLARTSEAQHSLRQISTLLVTDYIKWHRETRRKLQKCRSCHDVKFLILRGKVGGHGLGDRFRGVIHAYLCAVASGRFLLIDLPLPYPLGTVFKAGMSNFAYDERLVSSNLSESVLKNSAGTLWHFKNMLTEHDVVVLAVDAYPHLDTLWKLHTDFADVDFFQKVAHVMPFHVDVGRNEVYAMVFRALFKSSREMRGVLKDVVGKDGKIDIKKKYVGVHARIGWGVGEQNDRFDLEHKNLTLKMVAGCMAKEAMKMAVDRGVKPVRIYVGTDTAEFVALFKEQVGDAVVMRAKWKPTHIKKIKRKKHKKGFRLRYLHTFVDLFLLSRGEALLHLRSGFANLAAWMGGMAHTVLYEPEKECLA